MPDMVSFDYYVNTYLGTGIPEEQFSKWESRARQVLEKLCREYLVEGGENARAMAVCAMAEELHRSEGKEGVASTSIGGVKVQYREEADRRLLRRLVSCAGIYLDIYRGRDLCAEGKLRAV